MTSDSWPGVNPRLGRGAFAAGFIALGCITPNAHGAYGASMEFQGELNYDAFKRASDKGVGIRITQSPGGTGAAAMVLGRAKGLIIDGRCQSACAWAFVQNQSACFTSRASFDFHAAHDPGTGRRLTAATDYWLSTVGPELRSRLAGLRTSSNLIRLSAKEMTRYYSGRVCGASGPKVQVAEAKPRNETQAKPRAAKTAETAAAVQSPQPNTSQVAAAEIPAGSVWSDIGFVAMRVAHDGDGVTVASLLSQDLGSAPEPEAAFEPIENPITSFTFATNTADVTVRWPEASQTLWSGVVMSVAVDPTELAARHDSAMSDG